MFIKQHKSAVMMSSAAVLLMALGNSANASHVSCASSDSDPDGDGYGWENNHTCIVDSSPPTGQCVDDDGDGYGWNGTSTCDPNANNDGSNHTDNENQCIDDDGDGYGWNGTSTCDPNANNDGSNDTDNENQCIDDDGDGYGWNGTSTCDPNPDSGSGQQTVSPSSDKRYGKFEVDDLVTTINVYNDGEHGAPNELISYNGIQDSVSWQVPHNQANACDSDSITGPVKLTYRLTSSINDAVNRNSFVRAFPAMVIGTMGGRYESTGVQCGGITTLANSGRGFGSPTYDMAEVKQNVDFPTKGEERKETKISVKANINKEDDGTSANGIANVFVDTYWHDVSKQDWVPGKNSDYVGTINGINGDNTEVWNLNLWLDKSSVVNIPGRSDNGWTGGKIIAEDIQTGGFTFDVYFKKEGSSSCTFLNRANANPDPGNCFLYVGLVAKDQSLVTRVC